MTNDKFRSALKKREGKTRKENVYSHFCTLRSEPPKLKGSIKYPIPSLRNRQMTHCNILLGTDPTLNSLEFKTGFPPPSFGHLNWEIIFRRSTFFYKKNTINQET